MACIYRHQFSKVSSDFQQTQQNNKTENESIALHPFKNLALVQLTRKSLPRLRKDSSSPLSAQCQFPALFLSLCSKEANILGPQYLVRILYRSPGEFFDLARFILALSVYKVQPVRYV